MLFDHYCRTFAHDGGNPDPPTSASSPIDRTSDEGMYHVGTQSRVHYPRREPHFELPCATRQDCASVAVR